MVVTQEEINAKITYLNKIKNLKTHNDNWKLNQLIVTYQSIVSFIDSDKKIDKIKLTTYLESFEERFKYFINLNLQIK